jgi:hypothetical protein
MALERCLYLSLNSSKPLLIFAQLDTIRTVTIPLAIIQGQGGS